MSTDLRRLKPGKVCQMINSTPLGAVLTDSQLRKHRYEAGMRIGTGPHLDFLGYVAWLIQKRHTRPGQTNPATPADDRIRLAEEAALTAKRVCRSLKLVKQEALLTALLSERTYAAAARLAGISESTLYRRLADPEFRGAFESARKDLFAKAHEEMQSHAFDAVSALVTVVRSGRRDRDRIRASDSLLMHGWKGMARADFLKPIAKPESRTTSPAELVRTLTEQLLQLDSAPMSTAERSRLKISLADALLRALNVDLYEKRSAAIEDVLLPRKRKDPHA